MTGDLKPYPAYKDSGVPWLRQVPEHWELRRLRDSIEGCINGIWGSEPNGRDDLPCVRVADFHRGRLRVRFAKPTIRAIAPSERRGRILEKGDLLLEKSGGGDLQPVGVVMLFDHDVSAVCSNFVARMPVASGFSPGYLTYLHAYLYAIRVNVRSIKQTTGIQNLDSSAYLSEPIAFPPLPEQAAIARFLDDADRRIRRYIRAKQKLIKLLEEQKQAIIHRAVTRGLDPNVRLKTSGVEWLGDVPEHWEVRRVKSLSLVKHGASPRPIADPKYFDEAGIYAWVRIADVTASSRYLERTTQKLSALGQSLSVRLEPGALFLSIAGSVGKPIITRIKCCIHDGFVYFPQFHGNVEFLYRVFASGTPFARLGKLGTQLNLNTETVGSIRLGWPLTEEQTAIVSFLDDATEDLDAAIKSARREISLLREYRTRLIADVVTGKLDMREAAARLPDEVDEPEARQDTDTLTDGDADTDEADLDAVPDEAET